MGDLIAFYEQQCKPASHEVLKGIQTEGLAYLAEHGFPTRKDENWKYSPPHLFLKQRFSVAKAGQVNQSIPSALSLEGLALTLNNGVLKGEDSLSLPPNAFVGRFESALASRPGLLEPYLKKLANPAHGFHALNDALMHASLLIYLPQGQSLSLPLILSHFQDKAAQAVFSKIIVVLEKGAELTLIQDYAGTSDCDYLTSNITTCYLEEKAKLTHVLIQREGRQAFHFSQVSAVQEKGSQCDAHAFHFGGAFSRADHEVALQASKARCLLNSIYALNGRQHLDQHTLIHHLVPECESEQDYKGVLTGPSRAVFNGVIKVAKDAQHTLAKQQNKNLLLCDAAEVDTKPQLEIEADDVRCTHGATVGQLSEDALLYFRSRGILEQDAMHMMIEAFVAANLAYIDNAALRKALSHVLDTQFKEQD